jgi:hypothetical protein
LRPETQGVPLRRDRGFNYDRQKWPIGSAN